MEAKVESVLRCHSIDTVQCAAEKKWKHRSRVCMNTRNMSTRKRKKKRRQRKCSLMCLWICSLGVERKCLICWEFFFLPCHKVQNAFDEMLSTGLCCRRFFVYLSSFFLWWKERGQSVTKKGKNEKQTAEQ